MSEVKYDWEYFNSLDQLIEFGKVEFEMWRYASMTDGFMWRVMLVYVRAWLVDV